LNISKSPSFVSIKKFDLRIVLQQGSIKSQGVPLSIKSYHYFVTSK